MFSFPVTIPFRDQTGVFPVDVVVNIDQVLKISRLSLLNDHHVESPSLYAQLPATEILMVDGRKLPVLETAETIHRYLDAYRQIEDFYTAPATPAEIVSNRPSTRTIPDSRESGVVIPLFGNRSCDTSEAPTPV